MIKCRSCQLEKPLDMFQLRKETGSYRTVCNACRAEKEKQRRQEKSDEIREKDRQRWAEDRNGRRSRGLERLADRYYAMKLDGNLHEAEKQRNRDRAKRFAGKWRALVALRRKRLLIATPAWLTDEHRRLIKETKMLAKKKTKMTDVVWSVDHIVPIAGKEICGLHVPWNLQVIPVEQNKSKGNKLIHEQ